jgi:Fic family protein
MAHLLADWERFAHEEPEMPLLVQDALLHSQFETIHPFLDGNGRLGRLLLVFFLISRGRLPAPLLYLSSYLERNRRDYYYALQTIGESGDPLPWLELFPDRRQDPGRRRRPACPPDHRAQQQLPHECGDPGKPKKRLGLGSICSARVPL